MAHATQHHPQQVLPRSIPPCSPWATPSWRDARGLLLQGLVSWQPLQCLGCQNVPILSSFAPHTLPPSHSAQLPAGPVAHTGVRRVLLSPASQGCQPALLLVNQREVNPFKSYFNYSYFGPMFFNTFFYFLPFHHTHLSPFTHSFGLSSLIWARASAPVFWPQIGVFIKQHSSSFDIILTR